MSIVTPEMARQAASFWDPDTPSSTWSRIFLDDVATGDEVLQPQFLERVDGKALLYPGKVHWFQGESESCKTWAAMFALLHTYRTVTDCSVVWIDYEDNATTFLQRLFALGVSDIDETGNIIYIRPDEPLSDQDGGHATTAEVALQNELESTGPHGLIVIDGVTEAMTTEGLDLMGNRDIAAWMRLLPKRLAAQTGAAVVCIDHVVKNGEQRGRYAIGGQHKLAGVDGAVYSFKPLKPLSRATGTTEVTGVVQVNVEKDRPGYVRAFAEQGVVGNLELTAYPDGGLSVSLELPGGTTGPDHHLALAILEHLATYDGSSGRHIDDHVPGKSESIRAALKWMTDPAHAWIRVEQKGRSHLHWLTGAGHQELGR